MASSSVLRCGGGVGLSGVDTARKHSRIRPTNGRSTATAFCVQQQWKYWLHLTKCPFKDERSRPTQDGATRPSEQQLLHKAQLDSPRHGRGPLVKSKLVIRDDFDGNGQPSQHDMQRTVPTLVLLGRFAISLQQLQQVQHRRTLRLRPPR